MENYPFEFSIVMSVYNVEPWLREAVDSLIAQDFGFENIQLIMVDDGSTDGSGAICDEYKKQYPENIVVIHKENGGLSSARNAGVSLATGRYLNFFDPDDLLDKQVLSAVYRFFRDHEEEIDVVAIPLMLFGNQTGEHQLNYKFKKGTRVIDLEKEWTIFQMSLASAFLKTEIAKKYCFTEDLIMATAEDAKELTKILVRKPTLGVVADGYYRYRKRDGSHLQSSTKNALGYIPLLKDSILWSFQYSENLLGRIPKFIQFMVMYDLQWRIRLQELPKDILTEEEGKTFLTLLENLFQYVDDDVIIAQKNLFPEHKCWVLEKKHKQKMQLLKIGRNALLAMENVVHFALAKSTTRLEFFNICDGCCELEGYTVIYPTYFEDVEVFLQVNGELHSCQPVERNTGVFALGEPVSKHFGFKGTFPLVREREKYDIRVIIKIHGIEIENQNLNAGKFFPVSRAYASSYFVQDDWCVSMGKNRLMIVSCGRKGRLKREIAFLKELWKKNRLGARKAVFARLAYHALKRIKRKPLWLISDRIVKADDNGEAFFRYMVENHKEIDARFVISKQCDDFLRMKEIGPVVDDQSWKHKLLLLLCDYNISAQADEITSNPFPGYQESFRDILSQEKFVFLQHGVTQNDVSDWLRRYNKNFYGLVACGFPEYQSFLRANYSYDEKCVWLVGFPRFDRRYHDEKRCITIMPTWRMYLMQAADKATGLRELQPEFFDSAYFLFYHGLLTNEKLLAATKRLNYRLRLFIHPNLQHHVSVLGTDPSIEILGQDISYNEIYAHSDLVVTDYSSAVFDFVYLCKPLIYCQFDKEEFFAGDHVCKTGYFDYERDGFGEVEYDVEGTVDRIIEYMENGCQLKDKYRERIDNFFAFNDQNNCQRVYEKIMELEGKV